VHQHNRIFLLFQFLDFRKQIQGWINVQIEITKVIDVVNSFDHSNCIRLFFLKKIFSATIMGVNT
jgi:hypothetical protein